MDKSVSIYVNEKGFASEKNIVSFEFVSFLIFI
jgi:hypothetical protein